MNFLEICRCKNVLFACCKTYILTELRGDMFVTLLVIVHSVNVYVILSKYRSMCGSLLWFCVNSAKKNKKIIKANYRCCTINSKQKTVVHIWTSGKLPFIKSQKIARKLQFFSRKLPENCHFFLKNCQKFTNHNCLKMIFLNP